MKSTLKNYQYMCVDYNDIETFKAAQKHVSVEKAQATAFEDDFTLARRKARDEAGKGKGKGKGKKGKLPAPPGPLPSTIPQAEAKQYIPPDTSIWRGVTRSEWCAHCKPFKRIQEPWVVGGEHAALVRILARLWRQYLKKEALPLDACPYVGLLVEAGS